ncbi:MAG TPA: isopropylmalate isomerase [Rhodobacteraceae bacterium]|nr:isopropylmalate isomerase [Paracoccaceae bacterium]
MFDELGINSLLDCAFDTWQPGIGDPTVMGWVTVGAYLLTFALSVAVVRRVDPSRAAMRFFWAVLVGLMLFLAINKQLDLQSFATASARCAAKMQGWYKDRRGFQFLVVLALGAVAAIVGIYFLWWLRRDLKRNAAALIGMVFVFGFVLIRAVGWHNFDAIIRTPIASVRLNWILELSGPVLITINAIALLRNPRIAVPRRRRIKDKADAENFARKRKRRVDRDPSAFRRDAGGQH